MKKMKLFYCVVCLLAYVLPVTADVRLPAVISDNMVLQQKTKARIWGWADPGEKITVKASWKWFAASTEAGDDGTWQVKIDTPKAGGPHTIAIKANNTISLENIMAGEVWVCSGQSNMEMPLRKRDVWAGGVLNYPQEIATANYPNIRLFTVAKTVSDEPQTDCKGSWSQCSPETVADFSATAYFFGRYLHKELNIPIGLIHASWGGTPAESWTKRQVLEADPDLVPIVQRFEQYIIDYPKIKQKYDRLIIQWEEAVEKAKSEGKKPPQKPQPPKDPNHPNWPSKLYNTMIAPLTPFTIRGSIWYQGESNHLRAYQYRKLFPAMIKNWRADWGQDDFPFYYVQIAPWPYFDREPAAAELRYAQFLTLSVPNTGMVVTTDLVDDIKNIHPKNKQDVGKRLALWAMAKTYGRKDVVCSGPLYKSMKIEGDNIRLFFDYTGGGLVAKGGKLTHFTISSIDDIFLEAKAVIDGDTVVVTCVYDYILPPAAVHFGWSNRAMPNFFNKEGLPASPFKTDDWPGITTNEK